HLPADDTAITPQTTHRESVRFSSYLFLSVTVVTIVTVFLLPRLYPKIPSRPTLIVTSLFESPSNQHSCRYEYVCFHSECHNRYRDVLRLRSAVWLKHLQPHRFPKAVPAVPKGCRSIPAFP